MHKHELMRKTLVICLLLVLLLNETTIQAQSTIKDTFRIQQALSYYRISGPVYSPDGKQFVFTVNEPVTLDKPSVSHIWLYQLRDSSLRQYTYSAKSEFNPKWNPNGGQLSFLSTRSGAVQLFLLDTNGGEAMQLTHSTTGIMDYVWNPDGSSILYTANDTLTAEKQKRQDDKYDEEVAGTEERSTVLFSIDLSDKSIHRLPSKKWNIHELQWIPGQQAVLMVTEALPSKEIPEKHNTIYHLKDSSYSELPSPNHPAWSGITVAKDGHFFAFLGPRVDGPVSHDIYLQNCTAGKAINMTGKTIDLPVHALQFISNDTLLGIVQEGMHLKLKKISINGRASDYGIAQNVGSFDINKDKQLAFVSGAADQLPELWLASPGHTAVQLTHFNKKFETLNLVKPSVVRYKSFDGTEIETLLYKPLHAASSRSVPMVVIIHGGPTGAFGDSYNTWAQLFVQRGYAVMMPNIRGSTGYGWHFLESNRYDWGGGDFKDIMVGINYLVAHEHIDSNRLAIVGWSYGGYMSEWAITQTHRFKAAVSGAGLFNLASEFGTEGGAAYDFWHFGTPYENLANFNKHSAISFIKKAATPTLIIQGKDDDVDPIGQSQELYRALRYYHVPAELVLYPREHHGFTEIKHNLDFYTRMLNWVGRYCPVNN